MLAKLFQTGFDSSHTIVQSPFHALLLEMHACLCHRIGAIYGVASDSMRKTTSGNATGQNLLALTTSVTSLTVVQHAHVLATALLPVSLLAADVRTTDGTPCSAPRWYSVLSSPLVLRA